VDGRGTHANQGRAVHAALCVESVAGAAAFKVELLTFFNLGLGAERCLSRLNVGHRGKSDTNSTECCNEQDYGNNRVAPSGGQELHSGKAFLNVGTKRW
jgi:hypothetical protein